MSDTTAKDIMNMSADAVIAVAKQIDEKLNFTREDIFKTTPPQDLALIAHSLTKAVERAANKKLKIDGIDNDRPNLNTSHKNKL